MKKLAVTTTIVLVAGGGTAAAQATPTPAAHAAVVTQLAELAVKGRAPRTGYDRAQFGQAWTDDVAVAGGHNGCDTRNDILGRDLNAKAFKPGTRDCVVLTGTLMDPYTGRTIPFERGSSTSSAVQIDHVVALSDAWQKGAQRWDGRRRAEFANDPRNLLAVDGNANQHKGAGDAATWLPANKSFRCSYVAKQVEVKHAYALWVTQAERDAITRILASCGSPGGPTPPSAAAVATPNPDPAPRAAATAPAQTTGFANCSQARAAGAAPLHGGQPGYSTKLDRDGDGVACER